MVNLPILKKLNIKDYGLYPGKDKSGLSIEFIPGLTLILGSNGLGKTTLITIVYRILTGGFDIPRLNSNRELGTAELEPVQLKPQLKTVFAQRVMDNAANAKAVLQFNLGNNEFVVERNLKDLTLSLFVVNGEVLTSNSEKIFQERILEIAGLNSFGDWILILRYLNFYFEDRRALVWDPSAQWQILRRLFLPNTIAKKLASDERAILELDSFMRNTRALVTRQERTYAENEAKTVKGKEVIEELSVLQKEQESDQKELSAIEIAYSDWDVARNSARLRLLKAQQERESKYRFAEKIKLESIERTFPSLNETSKYILSQLMADSQCLVCGNESTVAAAEYAGRLQKGHCVICNSPYDNSANSSSGELVQNDLNYDNALDDLHKSERELMFAELDNSSVENSYRENNDKISSLKLRISKRSQVIDKLVRQLPIEEAKIHEQRNALVRARGEVNDMISQLAVMRENYRVLVDEASTILVSSSEQVKDAFAVYASGFLLETSFLAWAPKKTQVGQEGIWIDYPAFEIEMTGTDFESSVRRTGPEQVSESQREFIDLAFRMSLIKTADNMGNGTLVIDAPESSLDAVFVTRAADVLSRFARPDSQNRLIITSNLIEGKLIPTLLREAKRKDNISHLFDLFEVAEPTAAIKELRQEYDDVKAEMIK